MSSPHPSSKPAPRVPPPLPIPTFATQTGPEQSFASFANAHMRSMRSTRSSSSAVGGPSTSRASASASSTGPYVGLGQDAPPVASGSRKRKAPAAPASATADRKGKGKAKAEDEDDKATVDVSSTTAMAKGKVKGKGKEKAHPDEPQAAAAAAVEAASSRRRVIPPPQPGEESDEETNEAGMERLSDYQCPVCFCPPAQATLTPCGHLMCHLCLTTSLASTAIRTFIPPPIPRWKPIGSGPPLPLKFAPPEMNIEGTCPVCMQVLPGGLSGKGRRTGTAASRGGRAGRGGFGRGGKWKEADGKGEGVRRLEMRVVDC